MPPHGALKAVLRADSPELRVDLSSPRTPHPRQHDIPSSSHSHFGSEVLDQAHTSTATSPASTTAVLLYCAVQQATSVLCGTACYSSTVYSTAMILRLPRPATRPTLCCLRYARRVGGCTVHRLCCCCTTKDMRPSPTVAGVPSSATLPSDTRYLSVERILIIYRSSAACCSYLTMAACLEATLLPPAFSYYEPACTYLLVVCVMKLWG